MDGDSEESVRHSSRKSVRVGDASITSCRLCF